MVLPCVFAANLAAEALFQGRPPGVILFENDRQPEVPWSINVIRVPRQKSLYQLRSAHARGGALGLSTLSEQAIQTPSGLGTPVGGVNGDFYQRDGSYAGDPRGLQIVDGEMISAPAGSASFWLDANGDPHTTNTVSKLSVTWPNGSTQPIGLNSARGSGSMQLYTPSAGSSTRTSGGRELILEGVAGSPWLPLAVGMTYRARVREVRETGDTRLQPNQLVLSIGGGLLQRVPTVVAGAELEISTATIPDMKGARTAISGGPVLVVAGKVQRIRKAGDSYEFSSMTERHPRTAVGWNEEYFYLVEVDGRQGNLSVGMTLNELGGYMAELGCREAMNLDGGGSATLWYLGKVRNRPCDGRERLIANSLLVVRTAPSTNAVPRGGVVP